MPRTPTDSLRILPRNVGKNHNLWSTQVLNVDIMICGEGDTVLMIPILVILDR